MSASTAPHPRRDPDTAPRKKLNLDLSFNKVLAGAGAAATMAILGSLFGALGTVLGAALGSMVSTVVSTLYQHSLDVTRDTIKSRMNRGDDPAAETRVLRPIPAQRSPLDAETVRLRSPEVAERKRPRWLLWIGFTAAVFVLSLGVVTGIELIKGSTLVKGESGTSVGQVFDRKPAPATEERTPPVEETQEPTPTATPSPDATPEPSSSAESTPPATGTTSGSQDEGGTGADRQQFRQNQVVPTPSPGQPG